MPPRLTRARATKKILGGIALFGSLGGAGAAEAAKLVRCEVQLERAAGTAVVPGWGADEAQASARAREAAWLLAWADRVPLVLAGAVAVPGPVEERDAALRKALDPQTDWRVPGYAVREGACTAESAEAPRGEAFSARWEREDRKVIRNDPAVAIEGARRRQCFGAWSHRVIAAATAAKQADVERFAAAWIGARAASDGLIRCMGRGEHDVGPAGGALEGVADPGPVECRRPRRVEGRWTAAPAWGADLESAREAALRVDLELALVRLEETLGRVATMPRAEDRAAAAESVAMGTLGGLVVATDLAEQSLLSCESTAPKNARPTWTPPKGVACPGWPTGAWTATAALPLPLEGAREQACTQAFRSQAAGDWATALSCVASCRSDLEAVGWDGKLVWRPSEPSRATVEQAEKLLSAALAGKDFHLLGIATGGLIFEASYAAAFKANPTAFWGSIEQAKASGSWGELAYWEQVGGAWVLAFKERR